MNNANVLVVEDETSLADLVEHKLKSLGYSVAAKAPSGEEAIRKVAETSPDLVLMDIVLEGEMDGVEAAELIRSRFDIPVVYMTACADDATLERAKVTEPYGYILKPLKVRELQTTIEVALYKHEMEKRLRQSEQWLATTLKSIGDAVIATDKEGQITFLNRVAEALTGWTLQEASGRDLKDVFNTRSEEEDETVLQQDDPGRLREGTTPGLRNHSVLLARDGREIPIDVSTAPINDDRGQGAGLVIVFRDVAERRQAMAMLADMFTRLEQSRDDLLSILNQLYLGTAITDPHGRVMFLSEVAQRVFSKSQQEALGMHWETLFPLQEPDKTKLKAMLESPPHRRSKVLGRIEAAGGRQYWVEIVLQDDPRDPKRKIFYIYDVSEVHRLRRLLDEKTQFQDLVGKSNPILRVYQQIREVARVDSTVLIEGETGTGKELVARAIHFSSHRKDLPFIPVNCAGLTESLLTSQLFGHKRGAFTGAIQDHMGLFEAANGGTIFLDEIGDISLNVQTALLRVLEAREITRVGESRPRRIDVRVLVATNKDLTLEVAKGNFRSDLFYRIRVARILLPRLRERREDIPLLVEWFLSQCRATTGKPVEGMSNEAMRKLLGYDWPGNVRELRNAIEFAVIHCRGSVIDPVDLPPEIISPGHSDAAFGGIHQIEQRRLLAALESARGNRTVAARLLGISRATFYRRLADLNLNIKGQ
ncbi:MAG: sigma 54-interacting transcriptional regulator [Acidobacteria bacterium]|nr:sigma 54-interacting transcriptional regulator [Acidobacteriota bacterium]